MTRYQKRMQLAEQYADALVYYQTLHGELMAALGNDSVNLDEFDCLCAQLCTQLRALKRAKVELHRRKRETLPDNAKAEWTVRV